jgi:tRNA dimethylallyltransferase
MTLDDAERAETMLPEPFSRALILTGPTGSGKTRLALDLAGRVGAEIVCMDSMTLYRGMDIGTAKPTPEEQARVPHHLLDVLEPWESASVAWWLERAAACCREIESRGRRILFVGGTPLYVKALLRGLFEGPPADESLRARLSTEAEQQGRAALHDRLARVDPVSAARLHPNDLKRVVRALEVYQLTGRPLSSWQTQWTEEKSGDPSSPRCCFYLDLPRELLYQRIDARVRQMVAGGWIEEVRQLRELPRPLSREASQALGYRELLAHLEGQASLEETIRLIQTRTRQFAKRQLSWFRHLPGCQSVREDLTFSV